MRVKVIFSEAKSCFVCLWGDETGKALKDAVIAKLDLYDDVLVKKSACVLKVWVCGLLSCVPPGNSAVAVAADDGRS